MKVFKVTYIEEVAREVKIIAPTEEEVFKRFKEGNFPFTEGKEVHGDIRVYSVEEIEKKVFNFSEGDPL
jgi:hydrogenase maturation factor HypE